MRLEILLVLALVLVGGLIYYQNGGHVPSFEFSFFKSATSTDASTGEEGDAARPTQAYAESEASPSLSLSSEEIEEQVNEVYAGLDALQDNLRVDALHSPVSPYAGMVTLRAAQAKSTDPEKEYLELQAEAGNASAIVITGWRLESYVTKSKETIPEGTALLLEHDDRDEDPIALAPGERAYLITGETPLKVSFRENMCTGYLTAYGSFSPSLQKQCPLPGDEMLQYASVSSGDDECFEFVERIKRCETTDSDNLRDADLSGSCDSFIKNVLDYEGCVKKHKDEVSFFEPGIWRIYLDREGELWRSTREIIRLLDSEGRVVDVVEY